MGRGPGLLFFACCVGISLFLSVFLYSPPSPPPPSFLFSQPFSLCACSLFLSPSPSVRPLMRLSLSPSLPLPAQALLASRSLPHVGFDAFAGRGGEGGSFPLGRNVCDSGEGTGPGQGQVRGTGGTGQAAEAGAARSPARSGYATSEDLAAAARAALGPR